MAQTDTAISLTAIFQTIAISQTIIAISQTISRLFACGGGWGG